MPKPATDGGPAFPESHPECPRPASGLTKLEWFAGMAMASGRCPYFGSTIHDTPLRRAEWCFMEADAMLAESAATGMALASAWEALARRHPLAPASADGHIPGAGKIGGGE